MRTLRTRVLMLAALVIALGMAGTASAVGSITTQWISSTATGTTGLNTPNLTVGPGNNGATVVLRIFVNPDTAGVNAVGVVFNYDTSILGGAAETRCPFPAPGNIAAPGLCGSNFGGLLSTNSNAVNTPGQIGGIQTDGVPPAGQSLQFTFADMTFTIQSGTGTTGTLFLRAGIDGIVTTNSDFVIPTLGAATIQVIPEPGTIALMVVGLGALAFVGRRRR